MNHSAVEINITDLQRSPPPPPAYLCTRDVPAIDAVIDRSDQSVNLVTAPSELPTGLPPVLGGLIRPLADTHSALDDAYAELKRAAKRPIQTGPRLTGEAANDLLMASAAASTTLSMAAADLRAMLNAYSQVVATERPNLGALAALQHISPSALRHRYVDAHVEAVREMDRPDPLIDLIIEPFAGLREQHFEGLSESLDAQLKIRQRMRDAATQQAWSLNPDASSDSLIQTESSCFSRTVSRSLPANLV